MMQKLTYMGFEYSSTSLYSILNTPDDSDCGNYFVRDINYTNSCKDRIEQLALMPNRRKINDNDLGYREIYRGSTLGHPKGRARTEKLILDQNNKTEYMGHYRMLKFYVKMGVKVTTPQRVKKFKQDYICRDYIQNKTKKRAISKTEAEKDVRKIMKNSLYGSMCTNPLRFLQSRFLNDEEKIMKSICKPTFKKVTRYKDYCQIEYIKKKIEYDSPVYIGYYIKIM